jgi:hypothetical protein
VSIATTIATTIAYITNIAVCHSTDALPNTASPPPPPPPVPSHLRGSMNGLAMTFGSVAKALGPPLGVVIYTQKVKILARESCVVVKNKMYKQKVKISVRESCV